MFNINLSYYIKDLNKFMNNLIEDKLKAEKFSYYIRLLFYKVLKIIFKLTLKNREVNHF